MKSGITEYFDSMHYLPGHPKCGKPHGHTYRVDIVVEGEVRDGMIVDFAILKEKLRAILKSFDHTALNEILPYPSCENLCTELLERLKKQIPQIVSLRVWEGRGKWSELP